MAIYTICVDIDGVLAQYDGWKGLDHIGDPIPGSQQFISDLLSSDPDVVIAIYTTRCNPNINRPAGETIETLSRRVADWWQKHGFPQGDRIGMVLTNGKPPATVYIDDRAVVCRPQIDEQTSAYENALSGARSLILEAQERRRR